MWSFFLNLLLYYKLVNKGYLHNLGKYDIVFLHMSKVIIEVKKNTNESNMNLLRRFTRKVQETGVIQKVKGKRYNERKLSKLNVKKGTLKKLANRKERDRLVKLGKVVVVTRGRR